MDKIIPAGNEYVSLPAINEATAAIESITFLMMAQKGMVELRGSDSAPFIAPFVRQGDKVLPLTGLTWQRDRFWIPSVTASAEGLTFTMTVLSPPGERGFAVRLALSGAPAPADAACDREALSIGLRGAFGEAWHCVNENKPLEGSRHCYASGWNGSFIFDMRCGFPLFAFAPMADRPCSTAFQPDGSFWEISCTGQKELTVFFGLGFEEVAAATSAKEMLRRTWQAEYDKTARWLDARIRTLRTPALTRIYNTNLFFCLFYSTGVTLDTEELICATSRSSRYYVSAAYWDRDSLLWSFPAVLDADPALARSILEYVFTRQQRNFGIHSRYIDGTVLEPGIETDELVAPVLALSAYVDATGDASLLSEHFITAGVGSILKKLAALKHPEADLYETFLQPTDDEHVYPYLTYDNVLVWRAMKALSRLFPARYAGLDSRAEAVRRAIRTNCIFHSPDGKPYYAWSVDLAGRHDVYDEPPGSLQLLPYYGFCSPEDETWLNTVAMIRSPDYAYSFAGSPVAEIGCPHAPYPWVLSLCNSLLCGHSKQALKELEFISMDNGIACESVDPLTGECTTGAAFGTCAGFLCHALLTADKEVLHER